MYKLVKKTDGTIIATSEAPFNMESVSSLTTATYAASDVEWQKIDEASAAVAKATILAQIVGLETTQHRAVREYILAETDNDRSIAKERILTIESKVKSLREQYNSIA
ncbi:MAG TPA: hypothetical protein VN631_13150 [Negativicutes bacterium]|nr:hypothetical protein [Negativicutes bacterium]